MRLFRTQKPSKQTPSSSNALRSPPLSADSPSLRDLSSRIEPYTLGLPSPPPSSATHVHSDGGLYANGNMYASGGIGQAQREGSIHSQQDKSWTRGLFGGATTGREKEANAELMRMIGILTAAPPDDKELLLEVCERASANEGAAKEAARALRREFKYGEPSAQLNAARLWVIMLQNATDTFILQTASRKFLECLEEVVNSEATSPIVRERLLDVLASAAFARGKKPGQERFASTWRRIRPAWMPIEGIPFDQEDGLFDSALPRRAGVSGGPGITQGIGFPAGAAGMRTTRQQKHRSRQIEYIAPDGSQQIWPIAPDGSQKTQYVVRDASLLVELLAGQGASSSHSAAPAIPLPSSHTMLDGSSPSSAIYPVVVEASKVSARDLPPPRYRSPDHFPSPSNPARTPSPADIYKRWNSNSYPQEQSPAPPTMTQQHQPQKSPTEVPSSRPSPENYTLSQSTGGVGRAGAHVHRVVPHGPHRAAGRSRAPSPNRNGDIVISHIHTAHAQAQLYASPEPADSSPPPILVDAGTAVRNSNEEGDRMGKSRESDADLERLIMNHLPSDLTGQVVIPDERNRAHGGLADVYNGLLGGKEVAVKVLRMRKSRRSDADWEASNERRIKREMHVWAALKHQNVCEFLGYSTEFSDYPALISTWCHGGTASEYLDRQVLSIQERIALTQDVGAGLLYLHQLKVIHGDLKPTNILVDNASVAKLCDFGLVRLSDWEGPAGMTTTSPYTGTERYKAPELFITSDNRHPVATFEGDIYSLGSILLEFIEQIYPFKRFRKTQDLRDAIMDRNTPALRTESTYPLQNHTEYFWNLLEACWDDAAARPSIQVVKDALDFFTQAMHVSSQPRQSKGPD